MLAQEISQKTAIPFCEQVLIKASDTPSQTSLPRAVREINLFGAFSVTNAALTQEKKILIVDDVFTTGSTAAAVAEALKQAGAARVYVLTATTARAQFRN
jgi:predicted amidophosphoribosyltransferase